MSQASASAINAIEAAAGSIKTVYFTRLTLRAHLKPHKFEKLPRNPRPPPKIMPYYTSDEKRGYLSQKVQLAEFMAKTSQE